MSSPPVTGQSNWQGTPASNWLALLIGAVPLYGMAIYSGLSSNNGDSFASFTNPQLVVATVIAEVAFFGGLMLFALVKICGQSPANLNRLTGSPIRDLLLSPLALINLMFGVLAFGLVSNALGLQTIPSANLELGKLLASNSTLLLVFLGPVIWLKAALLEEFSRVFMLSRLWAIYSSPSAKLVCLFAVSLLFGLGHIWQGWYGVAGTAVIGLLLGHFYLVHGRVLPLIIAHGLYDTGVILLLVAMANGSIPGPVS